MTDETKSLTIPGGVMRLITIALIPLCGWIWKYGQEQRAELKADIQALNNKLDQSIKDRQVSEGLLMNAFRDEGEQARDKQELLGERTSYIEAWNKIPRDAAHLPQPEPDHTLAK